ncbi:hypothetical protein ACQEVB_21755 [Pseudonocardia sp. CA-107938]|uniref:hypothetical protein n=1 Tax=Pseudonocardia sp. CA-107938 TaxID=3240021 RepID=UPI003D90D551
MTTTAPAPARLPTELLAATSIWIAAVGAGVAEALVNVFLMPDPPSTTQLLVRGTIYAGVLALILTLPTGRAAVRWALALLLGVVGTLSLVFEPIGWLADGGDVAAFLATADGPTLLVVALRVLHLAAVAAAMVLMFRPRAGAYVRARTAERRAAVGARA